MSSKSPLHYIFMPAYFTICTIREENKQTKTLLQINTLSSKLYHVYCGFRISTFYLCCKEQLKGVTWGSVSCCITLLQKFQSNHLRKANKSDDENEVLMWLLHYGCTQIKSHTVVTLQQAVFFSLISFLMLNHFS